MYLIPAKAIVQAFWYLYFRYISFEMGYESPAAQNVAYGCGDLHKTEQVLGAFMDSGSQILLKFYLENHLNQENTFDNFEAFICNCYMMWSSDMFLAVLLWRLGYANAIFSTLCAARTWFHLFFRFQSPSLSETFSLLWLWLGVDARRNVWSCTPYNWNSHRR